MIFILIVIIIIIFLILSLKEKENFVIFRSRKMRNIYKKEGIKLNRNDHSIIQCKKKNAKITCQKIFFKHPFPHTNAIESIKTTINKARNSKFLKENNIPVPRFLLLVNPINEERLFRLHSSYKLRYPLVVKPVNGSKGRDVYLNINNFNKLFKTVKIVQNNNNNRAMIEEQTPGDNFRVLVVNNKVLDVVRRDLPYVVGDGKLSLIELIFSRNKKRISQKKYPTSVINLKLIYDQGNYTKKSIIPNGKKIYIASLASGHNGCDVKRIPLSKVHPQNLEMFSKINNILKLNISGIDYIANDISQPYNKDNHTVIEVNSDPGIKIHQIATPQKDIHHLFIKTLFN